VFEGREQFSVSHEALTGGKYLWLASTVEKNSSFLRHYCTYRKLRSFGVLPPQQPCSTDRTNRFLKNCTCRVEASSFEFFPRVAFRNGAFQFEIEIYIVNRSDEA
jgi:hypothetical protein